MAKCYTVDESTGSRWDEMAEAKNEGVTGVSLLGSDVFYINALLLAGQEHSLRRWGKRVRSKETSTVCSEHIDLYT